MQSFEMHGWFHMQNWVFKVNAPCKIILKMFKCQKKLKLTTKRDMSYLIDFLILHEKEVSRV